MKVIRITGVTGRRYLFEEREVEGLPDRPGLVLLADPCEVRDDHRGDNASVGYTSSLRAVASLVQTNKQTVHGEIQTFVCVLTEADLAPKGAWIDVCLRGVRPFPSQVLPFSKPTVH